MNDTEVISMSFEPGAASSKDTIPLCVPEIRGNEWKYVKDCLDTNWVSSGGTYVDQFERMIADYVGVKYAIATVNGTAAIHIALLVAGVQPSEEVLVPSLTFIAPANAVTYIGASPVFLDVDPNYWQLDSQRVIDFIGKECRWTNGKLVNSSSGRVIKAILPVHILGHPCDIDALMEIAQKYDLAVIEDATESLGARYKDRAVGAAGQIACFSFNGNKIITTGGGGMIATDNREWAERARYLTTQAKDNPITYVHKEVGYNYRLTNIQAAMGCAQMEQLNQFVERKREIAAIYNQELGNVNGIGVMKEASWACSAHWLYTILINEKEYGLDNSTLLNLLADNHIQTRPLWEPLHRSAAHRGAHAFDIKVADALHRQALSLPSSVGLTESDQHQVIDAIRRFQTSR